MKLHDKLDAVDRKDDFTEFLKLLKADFENNRDKWENWTIDEYLDAVSAWVEATPGHDLELKKKDWSTVATIFYAGKIYK